jgi:hypothetical protein
MIQFLISCLMWAGIVHVSRSLYEATQSSSLAASSEVKEQVVAGL